MESSFILEIVNKKDIYNNIIQVKITYNIVSNILGIYH